MGKLCRTSVGSFDPVDRVASRGSGGRFPRSVRE